MKINISKIPFSRYGSYLAFSQKDSCGNIYLNVTYGGKWFDPYQLFRLLPAKDGRLLPFEVEATPWLLVLKTSEGNIEIYLKGTEGAVIYGKGVSLVLEHIDEKLEKEAAVYEGASCNIMYPCIHTWCNMQAIAGSITKDGLSESDRIWVQPQGDAFLLYLEISLEQQTLKVPPIDIASDINRVQSEYSEWARAFGEWPEKYNPSANLAIYSLWSSTVAPKGHITRPAVLMSKNRMHFLWSWDHCFSALALINYHPGLAWDQLMVIFDKQMENGALPDLIGSKIMVKNATKPPIHGWCARKILDSGYNPGKEELEGFYKKLTLWTEWWFSERDDDKDGICQYNKGIESGWDNGSTFDEGLPVESPDLSAYLLLQIHFLADLAEKLGKSEEAEMWKGRYRELLDALIRQLWVKDRFVTVYGPEHKVVDSQSFLNHMPIVLGELLPKQHFEKLVEIIKREGDFLTPNGIASESVRSKKYKKKTEEWKGSVYWRGCIWAPVIYLVVDGLYRGGEIDLAKEISRRYCEMLQNSGSFYENYDALTGVGCDDPAYGWTASVFLMIVKKFFGSI